MRTTLIVCCVLLVSQANLASAGARSKWLAEALELAEKKFGKEVAQEGAENLSKRMTQLAVKHGDEVVGAALKKVGPRAGQIAADAGEHAGLALKLLAEHGDDALAVVAKQSSLNTVARYGNTATTALIKHGAVGEAIVERYALPGAEALVRVTPQNGRRLAMMAAKEQLKPELMAVITQHGDRACDFVWRNKKALAVAATLGAFVSNPEGFLDGTQKLVGTIADATVKPVAEIPKAVAGEIARNTNWTLLAFLAAAIVCGVGRFRYAITGGIQRLTDKW
jgi:hypothetical protein